MFAKKLPPKIILFNGPPSSGKDTAAILLGEILAEKGVIYGVYSFAAPLKRATHDLFGMLYRDDKAYEKTKDLPVSDFLGMTPRQAYIKLSEEAVKPVFGKDFFAKVAVQSIYRMQCNVVVTDCGFQTELDVLAHDMGADNIWVVRLFRDNCSYVNDSRGYVDHSNAFDIMNDGTLEELQQKLRELVEKIGEFK